MIRSFLFVPGDSERKLAKAMDVGADALILDLEDAVAAVQRPAARALVAEALAGERPCQVWVRINPLDTPDALADLGAVMAAAPDGIVLPKAAGPADVRRLSHYLDAFEAAAGRPVGATPILPVATETAAAPFALGDYAGADLLRLYGLTWGAEDLSAALGASTNRGGDGDWALTYRLVRSLTLLAARAAGVEPVDTLHADFRDEAGLAAACRAARGEGWSGKLAIHPAQVAVINEGFMPSAEEVAHARAIVAAFAAAPGVGTVGLDGAMLDRPHLVQAERLLAGVDQWARSRTSS